jgi:hypothetical protein
MELHEWALPADGCEKAVKEALLGANKCRKARERQGVPGAERSPETFYGFENVLDVSLIL